MNRAVLLAIAACISFASPVVAEEFLVHVDTLGYVDRPVSEQNPKESVLRSIEVTARLNEPFRAKVIYGKETLVLSGEVRRGDNGDFAVQYRHLHTVDSGNTVPARGGGWEPVLDITEVQSTASVELDTPRCIGGMETVSDSFGKGIKSRSNCVLTLTRHDPTVETSP